MLFKFVWLPLVILIPLCNGNLAKVVDYQPQQIHIAYGGQLLAIATKLKINSFNVQYFVVVGFCFFVHRN